MGWFSRRKPRDLIADSLAEAEVLREVHVRIPTAAPSVTSHWSRDPNEVLIAAGGWCAPSDVNYGFLDLPKIRVDRGGVRW